MEDKPKSLKDVLLTSFHAVEPDLRRTLLSVWGDPRIVYDKKDERVIAYNNMLSFQRKIEKLEYRRMRTDYGDPELEVIHGRMKTIKESLAAIQHAFPEYFDKKTKVRMNAVNEWIRWAREMSEWYRSLRDHPESSSDDQQAFERIAGRYDENISSVQKLCKGVEYSKTALANFPNKRLTNPKRMLCEFVEDVNMLMEYYKLQCENTGRDLERIISRHSIQADNRKYSRRR